MERVLSELVYYLVMLLVHAAKSIFFFFENPCLISTDLNLKAYSYYTACHWHGWEAFCVFLNTRLSSHCPAIFFFFFFHLGEETASALNLKSRIGDVNARQTDLSALSISGFSKIKLRGPEKQFTCSLEPVQSNMSYPATHYCCSIDPSDLL